MSLYQLHRCVFDFLRAGEVSSGAAPNFDVSSYDLTDEERKVFESKDVAALYRMGFHPVLLNVGADHQCYIIEPPHIYHALIKRKRRGVLSKDHRDLLITRHLISRVRDVD